MIHISQKYLVFFSAIAIAVVVAGVFVGFASKETALAHREKIFPYSLDDHKPSAIPVTISDMEPNSVVYFMYPPGLSPLGNENHFQKFMLIRLPAWMGGTQDDISSFRAYSAVDLASHCFIKYWKEEGRQRIEDPCTSPAYRVIDGISESWPHSNFIRAPSTGALPMLDISADSDGTIYVEPPVFSVSENGAIGTGREVTQSEFDRGTILMQTLQKRMDDIIEGFNAPDKLSTGHVLVDIQKENGQKTIHYSMPDDPQNRIILRYEYCDCTKTYKQFLETEGKSYYAGFWNINGTDIYATPGKVDVRNNIYSLYSFVFYFDGFRVSIITDLEFEKGMQVILENYFAEFTINDVVKIDV